MAKEFARAFYKSAAWRQCRDAYFEHRCGICERCGDPAEIVHHKTHLNAMNINDALITLSWDSLELLCLKCHNAEHMGASALQPGYYFNEDGDYKKA